MDLDYENTQAVDEWGERFQALVRKLKEWKGEHGIDS